SYFEPTSSSHLVVKVALRFLFLALLQALTCRERSLDSLNPSSYLAERFIHVSRTSLHYHSTSCLLPDAVPTTSRHTYICFFTCCMSAAVSALYRALYSYLPRVIITVAYSSILIYSIN